jgi:hypothetical protein
VDYLRAHRWLALKAKAKMLAQQDNVFILFDTVHSEMRRNSKRMR